jgi:hypothetical protein
LRLLAARQLGTHGSSELLHADPSFFNQEPSHSIVNASQTWTSHDGRRYISFCGKNIDLTAPLEPVENPGAPRTYGVMIGGHLWRIPFER